MSTIKADTLSNLAGTQTVPVSRVAQGTAAAWVNFNGTTATPSTIRAAFNVSSVTKNGTGDYTLNFTTAMPDANYAVVATGGIRNVSWGIHLRDQTVAASTTAYRYSNVTPANALTDTEVAMVAIFR